MKLIAFYILLLAFGFVRAQSDSVSTDTLRVDSILPEEQLDLSFVNQYDSMLVAHYRELNQFSWDTNDLNIYNLPPDSFPKFSNDVFAFRIGQLNEQSPFEFKSNGSTIAMIKLYAYKRKKLTSKMLAYAELYFPIFEEYLIKYNMPLELKYLPIVESAMNPTAKSPAGAGGLWQFMPRTGQMYDLDITSYVDKRFDPYLATDAACKYLKFLHSIYGDWSMALAAYNAGPGNVNKAIRRSGGKTTYWEIRPYLFKETQNYVPAFIAANYVMNYASHHNLYPREPQFLDLEIDTVHVCKRVEFLVLEEWLEYGFGKIKYLNPMYIANVIPTPDSTYSLRLPRNLIGYFIEQEDSIYKYSSVEFQHLVAANKPKRVQKTHYIKSGESMHSIAKKYKCTTQDIKAWNNRTTTRVKPGKKLVVFVEPSEAQKMNSKPEPKTFSGEYTYYTIQKGDTLWDIAQKYKGVSVDDIKRHNSHINSNNLKTGTKVKIVKK